MTTMNGSWLNAKLAEIRTRFELLEEENEQLKKILKKLLGKVETSEIKYDAVGDGGYLTMWINERTWQEIQNWLREVRE